MKRSYLFATAFLLFTFVAFGQEKKNPTAEGIDKTLTKLYAVISGEKGEERNWDEFRALFHPEAKLIPTGKDSTGTTRARYMTPDDYISGSGKWLVENGFFEKEINRQVQVFGNIAQVFSTYESFRSASDTTPFMRGINSIQLLFDGEQWVIVNIFWMQESEAHPIPEAYLPQQ